MYEPPPGCATVFRTRQRGECQASRLVLEAAGIPARTVHWDGWWLLVVTQGDLAVSTAELEAYDRENADSANPKRTPVPIYGGGAAGVVVYSGTLILIAVLAAQSAYGLDWLTVGRMQSGKVMSGEWWRTVTALTLHLDTEHITANLAFGALFGFLTGQILGGGVAWLAIVSAGALGNFVNAMVQEPLHSSIGASTAVFAALGVIVSHAFRHRGAVREKPLKRWSPLIGGVLLLAFTGVGGQRTDVVAHVTGFFSGMLIGWAGCRLPHAWMASRKIQTSAGVAAIVMVATAWAVGLVVAG
jgi:rhomboid protease GluP